MKQILEAGRRPFGPDGGHRPPAGRKTAGLPVSPPRADSPGHQSDGQVLGIVGQGMKEQPLPEQLTRPGRASTVVWSGEDDSAVLHPRPHRPAGTPVRPTGRRGLWQCADTVQQIQELAAGPQPRTNGQGLASQKPLERGRQGGELSASKARSPRHFGGRAIGRAPISAASLAISS